MFSALLLTTAMASGQPPAALPPAPMPPAALPVRAAAQPPAGADAPGTTTGNGAGATPGGGSTGTSAATNPAAEAQEKADKEEPPPERTRYFVERSLAETRLGKLFENNGIVIYGWTGMSYTVSTTSQSDAPITFNDRANEFLLNQNWLHIEKTIDTSKKEFQLGFVTDWILPGSDYRFTVARGLWDEQLRRNNGAPNLYGIDPVQLYVQAWFPELGPQGTKVIAGRFVTHVGYELIQQVDTPFVSKSYLFQYDPFTHTGVWATTQLTDDWSVGNGLSTGTDTFFDAPTNKLAYLGQLRWAPKDGKSTVAFNAVVTDPTFFRSENFTLYNCFNITATHKFTDKLTYALDTTYSYTKNAPIKNGGPGYADWYGAANYLIYSHTDTVASTVRAEVFNDVTGFRTGFEGLFTEVTYGVAWKPLPGLIIRPSVRFDYNGYSRPFEGDHHMWTGVIEAIVRW